MCLAQLAQSFSTVKSSVFYFVFSDLGRSGGRVLSPLTPVHLRRREEGGTDGRRRRRAQWGVVSGSLPGSLHLPVHIWGHHRGQHSDGFTPVGQRFCPSPTMSLWSRLVISRSKNAASGWNGFRYKHLTGPSAFTAVYALQRGAERVESR